MRRRLLTLSTTLLLAIAATATESQNPMAETEPTASWNDLLERHARDGGIDYAALAEDGAELDRYLAELAAADPSTMSAEDALAFWINAYNAAVAKLVLERYPGIVSVKDVDGFFDELTVEIAGEALTLDEIEAKSLESGDARVHFAVVCASESCPDLRSEAYVGERLDEQLQEQTVRFLRDPNKGMRWDPERKNLHLSSIFMWYAGDFTGGSTVVAFFARSAVADWVLSHLPEEEAAPIRDAVPGVRYIDYDWSLNDR